MTSAKLFFGGLPTEPDVAKLVDRFGVPTVGMIAHEEITAIIGVSFRAARYRTIVALWRRKLVKDHNIDTEAEPGVGIRVLTERERIGAAEGDFRTGTRRIRKATRRAHMIPTEKLEATEDRARAEHLQRLSFQVYETAAAATRKLAPPPATKALPRAAEAR